MHFSNIHLILALAASTLAMPLIQEKRASAIGTSPSVLTEQTYNEISVSNGTAGNALAEVNAKFPIDTSNLAGVSASDLEIIGKASQIGESAETSAFDPAIDAAGGADVATALQNGKIKNKVLKLQTSVLQIQIQQAQGDTTLASQLQEQQTKLNTNVQLDEAAAGQASTAVSFDASD